MYRYPPAEGAAAQRPDVRRAAAAALAEMSPLQSCSSQMKSGWSHRRLNDDRCARKDFNCYLISV